MYIRYRRERRQPAFKGQQRVNNHQREMTRMCFSPCLHDAMKDLLSQGLLCRFRDSLGFRAEAVARTWQIPKKTQRTDLAQPIFCLMHLVRLFTTPLPGMCHRARIRILGLLCCFDLLKLTLFKPAPLWYTLEHYVFGWSCHATNGMIHISHKRHKPAHNGEQARNGNGLGDDARMCQNFS